MWQWFLRRVTVIYHSHWVLPFLFPSPFFFSVMPPPVIIGAAAFSGSLLAYVSIRIVAQQWTVCMLRVSLLTPFLRLHFDSVWPTLASIKNKPFPVCPQTGTSLTLIGVCQPVPKIYRGKVDHPSLSPPPSIV